MDRIDTTSIFAREGHRPTAVAKRVNTTRVQDNLSEEANHNGRTTSKPILERWFSSPTGQTIKTKAIQRLVESCQNSKPVITPPPIHFPDLAKAGVLGSEHFSPLKKLYDMAQKSPNEVFIIKGKEKYTYSQILEESRRVAQGLKNRGVGYGDSVATMFFPNELEFFTNFFGIQMTGAVPVLANYLSPETIPKKLDECNAQTLILGRHWELHGGANNLSFAGLLKHTITAGQTKFPKRSLKDDLHDLGDGLRNSIKILFDKNTYNKKTLRNLVAKSIKAFLGKGFYNPFADTYDTIKKDGTYDDNQFILSPPLDAPESVLFSSNTSGSSPKRITYTNNMISEATKRVSSCIKLTENDKMLFCVPPNHLAALIVFFGALNYECPLTITDIPRRSEPESIDKALHELIKNEVTVLPGVPQIVENILTKAREKYETTHDPIYLLSSLRLIFSGGGELTNELKEVVRWLNTERANHKMNESKPVELIDFYAATEVGPAFAVGWNITKEGDKSVMYRYPGIEVKLSCDGRNEILVRGPIFSKSEIPPERFTSDGFFKTNDRGKEEDGVIKVCGRLDDVIIRGGENILPSQINAAVKEVSGVDKCYAFGLYREEKRDYLVGALVIPKKGTKLREEDVFKGLSNINKLLIPHRIFIEDELPGDVALIFEKSGGKNPLWVLREKYKNVIQVVTMDSTILDATTSENGSLNTRSLPEPAQPNNTSNPLAPVESV